MAILTFFGSLPNESFIGRTRAFTIETLEEFLIFDLLLDETHSFPFEVTTYNVEDGSDITENIRLPLRSGSITGFVSNLSILRFTSILVPFDPPTNWAQEEFDTLKRIRESKSPVTIVTNLDIYEDALITDITVDRSSDDGESQSYNISFIESNIVKLQTVAIDLSISLQDMKSALNRQAATRLQVGRR
jgi:hypothetical protein